MRFIKIGQDLSSGGLGILMTLLCASCFAQTGAGWVRSEKTDAFTGTTFTQFVLTGQFLTAPQKGDGSAPQLIVNCKEKDKKRVYYGEVLSAHLVTGTVLNHGLEKIPVLLRLDDGKPQTDFWVPSTDGTAAFFPATTLNNLLYGHLLPHKENTGRTISKVVLALDEAFAARIVIQFDMPDPNTIADTCGVIFHKN
jgi:hypothetical protein